MRNYVEFENSFKEGKEILSMWKTKRDVFYKERWLMNSNKYPDLDVIEFECAKECVNLLDIIRENVYLYSVTNNSFKTRKNLRIFPISRWEYISVEIRKKHKPNILRSNTKELIGGIN